MMLKTFIHILFRPVFQHNLQIMVQEMLGYNTKKTVFLYCTEVFETLEDLYLCA
jgi:hypothetical protein